MKKKITKDNTFICFFNRTMKIFFLILNHLILYEFIWIFFFTIKKKKLKKIGYIKPFKSIHFIHHDKKFW